MYGNVLAHTDEQPVLLAMPSGSEPIAVLCLGPVNEFYPQPMLQAEGWATPRPLAELLFQDEWGSR